MLYLIKDKEMNPMITYLLYTFLASILAFLKLFNKTNNYNYFVILGILFSIVEFILRLPTKTIGTETLKLSVSSMQIIWVGANLLINSVLSLIMYGDQITFNKIIGMTMILFGLWVGA